MPPIGETTRNNSTVGLRGRLSSAVFCHIRDVCCQRDLCVLQLQVRNSAAAFQLIC